MNKHSVPVGYVCLVFGFLGFHRFYFGKPWTGLLYLCTFGLLGIGWVLDFFKIPEMQREAELRFAGGEKNINVAWLLFWLAGIIGLHRLYLEKWLSGVLYLFTFGIFGMGYLYDMWHLNEIVSEENKLLSHKQNIFQPT